MPLWAPRGAPCRGCTEDKLPMSTLMQISASLAEKSLGLRAVDPVEDVWRPGPGCAGVTGTAAAGPHQHPAPESQRAGRHLAREKERQGVNETQWPKPWCCGGQWDAGAFPGWRGDPSWEALAKGAGPAGLWGLLELIKERLGFSPCVNLLLT